MSKKDIETIEIMHKDGYFRISTELEKAKKWAKEGKIPTWLRDDMKEYEKKGKRENVKTKRSDNQD